MHILVEREHVSVAAIPPLLNMATTALRNQFPMEKDGGSKIDEVNRDGEGKGRISGLGGCLLKSQSIPVIQIKSDNIRRNFEIWREKDLIGKILGVWPQERDLVCWIKSTWNPKGHYDLHLGSKGFLTIIFFN